MPWLLVFDDADNIDDVSQYIPASNQGSVILTSRRRDIIILKSLEIQVAPIGLDTGAKLLDSLMQNEDSSGLAREIVNLLDGHPLAICQAAKYAETTAATYREFLELYTTKLFNFSNASDARIHSIHGLFETTLASVSPDARRLLEYMAFTDPDQIPEELFLQDIEDVMIAQKYVSGFTLQSSSD